MSIYFFTKDDCIEAINKIDDKSNTILLLDGLDENKKAITDYESFGSSLEKVTCNFIELLLQQELIFLRMKVKREYLMIKAIYQH